MDKVKVFLRNDVTMIFLIEVTSANQECLNMINEAVLD